MREKYGWPWYDYYDGPKPIVVGHRQYLEDGQPLIVNDRLFCIDTGCVRGGRLTGLTLPDFTFVSVPARENHWHRVAAAFTGGLSQRGGVEAPKWTDDGYGMLFAIVDHIMRTHESVMAELRLDPSFDARTEREQAKAYAAKVAGHPLESWLHRARQGKLDVETLRRYFWWPERAENFAAALGLLTFRPFWVPLLELA